VLEGFDELKFTYGYLLQFCGCDVEYGDFSWGFYFKTK
jgi:hypothetical protein